MTLTEADLAAIEARAEAATPGPWSAIGVSGAPAAWYCYTGRWSYERETGSTWWSREDAEFEAHARTDVPALVAAVRATRAALRRYTDIVELSKEDYRATYGPIEDYADAMDEFYRAALAVLGRDRAPGAGGQEETR